MSSDFAFSLAAAFLEQSRRAFEAVPVATSRTTEASGAAPGPWTEVSWDAWSENYRDLGKDRTGMQCSTKDKIVFVLRCILVLISRRHDAKTVVRRRVRYRLTTRQ